MLLKPKTKSIVLSLLVHISVLCLLVFCFYHENTQQTYKVPGQFKMEHAYLVSKKMVDIKAKKHIMPKPDNASLHSSHLSYNHKIHKADKPQYQSNTTPRGKISSAKSLNKKSQLAQTKAIAGKELNQLIILIYKSIDKNKVFPRQAEVLHQKGKVVISFILYPNGEIKNIFIVKSSGFKILDNAALTAIQKSSPIHGTKQYLKTAQNFTVPIGYHFE